MGFYFCRAVVNQTTALCSPGALKPRHAQDPGQTAAADRVEPGPGFQLDDVTANTRTLVHCLQRAPLDLRVATRKGQRQQ